MRLSIFVENSYIFMRSLHHWWLPTNLWCYHFKIIDYPLFCGRIQFYCNAMTSKLMITHYFVDCDKTHMHCDAVTSKMMIDHYFVDRFFRAATISWVEFDERSVEGLALFREPSSFYFVIEFICIVMRSLQKWWLTTISWTDFRASHFFVGRIRRMQWGGPTK